MPIVIVPPSATAPAGKLADAELHFTTGPLAGLTLVGFGIWESQWPGKHRSHPHLRVTVPSREYTVNGETRRFDLLRSNDPAITDALRDAILDAYAAHTDQQLAPAAVVRQVARAAQAKSSAYRGQPVSDDPVPVRRPAPIARAQAPAVRPAARAAAVPAARVAPRGQVTRVPAATVTAPTRRSVRLTSHRAPEPLPHTDDDCPF